MDGDEPLPPAQYRELSMASVSTHDFPPTAGFLEGVQVDVRQELGLLARPVEEERAEARRQLDTFFAAVAADGLLPDGDATDEQGLDTEALARLLHWLRLGPPHARVSDVQTSYSERTGLNDFHVY